jgi:hypothetical protein
LLNDLLCRAEQPARIARGYAYSNLLILLNLLPLGGCELTAAYRR